MRARDAAFGLALALAATTGATAADVGHGYANDEVVLQGTIKPGDCQKLTGFISKEGARRVYLASSGGDLMEAMRIGHLIRVLKLSTVIPGQFANNPIDKRAAMHNVAKANYTCASACFFAFAAGISRGADGFEPILGIHRPYIAPKDLSTLTGDQAMAASRGTRTIVETYLREMDVPTKYVDRMYAVGPDEIAWVTRDDFEADLNGVIPDLRDWVTAKADTEANELREELKATDGPNATPQAKAFFKTYLDNLTQPVLRERTVIDELNDETMKRGIMAGNYPAVIAGLCK